MPKANKNEIVITVEGGVIQDVHIPQGCAVSVKVMDFDIEGSQEEDLKTNKRGEQYVESYWKIA